MLLFLKNLLFTVLVPGTVAFFLPYAQLPPGARPELHGASALGVIPLLLGAAIYFWCLWHFARTGRGTPAPIDPPRVLVVQGLYRWTRNPMYVGVLLAILGQAILFQSWPILRYALLVLLGFHLMVVLYEEPTLRRKFGPAYDDYHARVPRWLPIPGVTRRRNPLAS